MYWRLQLQALFRLKIISLDFSQPVPKKNIASFRSLTGMVFQSYNLFPHKTALENVMEGPSYGKKRVKREC